MKDYDYGIIGGGPAGYTAGILLARQGYSVILFEKDKLGGTCLNRGCIPTKSLLHYSGIYSAAQKAAAGGLFTGNVSFDFAKIIEKKDYTVEKIRKSLESEVKKSGVTVVYAGAFIKEAGTIRAESQEYHADKILWAAGSKPRKIKGLEFDGEFILSSDDVLNLPKLPKSVLIIGSGAIGTEWARIFADFNIDVSIVETAEHLIPAADIDVSKRLERIFRQKKIKFYLKDGIHKISGRIAVLTSGIEIEPDFILVAAGREPVRTEYTDNISVLGDSAGEIMLAHYAISQAKEFALNIPCDKNLIPSVIYGEPEIAWAGLREQDCDETYTKTLLPLTALGKAWCDDSIDGFIKVITKDNLICGAHIISKEASSLIHTLLAAMRGGIKIDYLKQMCFAHPSYSEGIFDVLMRAGANKS